MPVSLASEPADPGEGSELTLDLAHRIAPMLARRTEGLAERTPADLTFGNLWLFRGAHHWRWHDGSWPCVSGLAYDGQRLALPLFDMGDAPMDALSAIVSRYGGLFPLCEREAQALASSPFELKACRDDADYIYPAQQFRLYRGRALQK